MEGQVNLTALLDEIVAVPRPLRHAIAGLLGFRQADELYHSLQACESGSLPDRLLHRLAVTVRMSDRDLQQVPRNGPVIVVANHPFGILEGAVLATVLKRARPDVRFLANKILSAVPELNDLLVPVDPAGSRSNLAALRRSIEFLESGNCLVVFPAGEVSSIRLRERTVADSEWHTSVARVTEALARRNVNVSVVPIYIEGSNSFLFHLLGLIHPTLRTMLLARELLNKRNRTVELRIGSAIPSRKLLEIPGPRERTDYLRWRTYLLAKRPDYKARTSMPLRSKTRRPQQPVCSGPDSAVLAEEIRRLEPGDLLTRAGGFDVYLSPAAKIPALLQEIGRLREATFRAAGEGTGKSTDLDRFDSHYLHLFAWNAKKEELVGAYRLAGSDRTRDLYTATLFKYDDAFLHRTGPALELGRSFVRAEYQKGFGPLLALWKGIGAYIARNPRYKILFGPVSISNQYQAVSRELMVSFLERNASVRDLMQLISNRNPFRRGRRPLELPGGAGLDIEDLSQVISDIEPSRAGVPVLLRQYLKLGGKLLGFNVDPEFSWALDGLILVDLTQTEPKLLERYLGSAEAAAFLGYQKGHHGT